MVSFFRFRYITYILKYLSNNPRVAMCVSLYDELFFGDVIKVDI